MAVQLSYAALTNANKLSLAWSPIAPPPCRSSHSENLFQSSAWNLRSVSRCSCLLRPAESREWVSSIAVSDVPGSGSRMHTYDHGGSEAHDELSDSILSSEPKPLGKHRPHPLQSILSLGESSYPSLVSRPVVSPWRLVVIYESYHPEHPLVKHTSPMCHAHGAQQAL
ncbi:hypothetical protein Tco_1546547 [Tanacetum coccineum]